MRQFVSPLKIALLSSSKTGCLLRITYLKTESPHLVGRATPDAAGKARPTVNHLTVMNYVKLNRLHVKSEVHHIAILHHILLAFHTHLAGIFRALLALVFHEIVEGNHFGTNETALEVVVDHARRLGGGIAFVDGPCPHFFSL